jgi:hypothetical protein
VDVQSDLGEEMRGMIFVETRATAFALAKYISEELRLLGYKAAPFTGSKSNDSSEGKSLSLVFIRIKPCCNKIKL